MFNTRKQLLLERAQIEQKLRYHQIEVMTHKNKILGIFYHQYALFLMGLLSLAFLLGWKIGKDLSIKQISKQMLSSGLLLFTSQYPLAL